MALQDLEPQPMPMGPAAMFVRSCYQWCRRMCGPRGPTFVFLVFVGGHPDLCGTPSSPLAFPCVPLSVTSTVFASALPPSQALEAGGPWWD